MSSTDHEARLSAIEGRLYRMEAQLAAMSPAKDGKNRPADIQINPAAATAEVPPATDSIGADPFAFAPTGTPAGAPVSTAVSAPVEPSSAASNILGWGGAFALVLAASYLIRLGVDSGWLTPARQLSVAALFGLALIGTGFLLRDNQRRYAGLLPAAGVAILFMTVYGAHLYYALISVKSAFVMVVMICAVSLWLCRAFESDLYALLAVVGSYSAPLLLYKTPGALIDLALYFSVWSVVFSVFAIWCGRRAIYLLALYLALIGFDIAALSSLREQWVAVLVFQAVQFAIFGVAIALFSVRHDAPLSKSDALLHLPPLLLFYFLEYHILNKYLTDWAPWLAVASLAVVALLYVGVRARLRRDLPGGELLLWCYAALVLFHAGFIESVPDAWAPWVALIAVPIAVFATLRDNGVGARWPIWLAVGVFFVANYLLTIVDMGMHEVVGRDWLPLAYGALLYAGYGLGKQRDIFGRYQGLLLFMAHLSAMAAAVRLINEPIIESGAWGLIAIACLALAWRTKDKLLAQSSLVVFAATALKVMMVDLSGAAPMARIVGLVVIGITFYAGGLLYRWVARDAAAS